MASSELQAVEKRIIDARTKLMEELEQQIKSLCEVCPYRQLSYNVDARLDKLGRDVRDLLSMK